MALTCERADCSQPVIEGRRICREHWNEYMRNYRLRSENKRERAADQHGREQGIQTCVRFLREAIGNRALTGYQAARELERGIIAGESSELRMRRSFLQTIGG